MRVKKYVADSMPAALQQIRQDLGDQAVILNTKEVRSGGFFGLFGKRRLEVIAAARNANDSSPSQVANQQPAAVRPQKESSTTSEERREIMRELKSVKEMLSGLLAGEHSKEKAPPSLSPWMRKLREQEVDGEVIRFFVEQITRFAPSLEEEEIERVLIEQARKLIEEGSLNEETLDPEINVVSFVGPTGVGKTTTIAKIASDQALNHHRRVGFLTTDTYRIAAVEQLRTYANILNVPIETVFSPDGLKKAIKNLKDCDLILIDTAGRNYRDRRFVDEIGKYLDGSVIQENYLVLSMTAKYGDLKQTIDNFQNIPIDKIIMTKMDETFTYGPLLNIMYHYPYPVAYITTGQNVPDDIERVDPAKIVKLMLGVEQVERRPSPSS